MAETPRCQQHPAKEAVTRCAHCELAMCDDCWQLVSGSEPWCVRCAAENAHVQGAKWRLPLLSFVGVLSISSGLAYQDWVTRGAISQWTWLTCIGGSVLVLVVALAHAAGREAKRDVRPRPPDAAGKMSPPGAHPYRSRLVVARRALAAPISGKLLALVLTGCFALSAVLAPLLLRRPRWQEAEVVLALWWLFGAGTISGVVYSGRNVLADHAYVSPSFSGKAKRERQERRRQPTWSKEERAIFWQLLGCGLDGCWVVLVAAIAVVAAWIVVEAVLPALFFVAYLLIVKALRRAVQSGANAKGKLGRALLIGLGWSAVFVAPLALLSYALHLIWAAHGQ